MFHQSIGNKGSYLFFIRAILHAAEHPVRDLYVGVAAKALAMGGHFLPRLVDRGMELLMFRLQKTRKPPYPKSQHNLYSASADMKERSPVDAHIFKRSWYTEATMRPKAGTALALAAGLTLWAVWYAKRTAYPQ